MARGARERSGSDVAVSTTGIAGPGGGSAEKPAGLCYVALAAEDAAYCRMMLFSGDRGMVRTRAVYTALDTLRLFLIGERERLEPFRAAEDSQ
jgi:nicotinamide-nucleotide amidase